MARMQPRWLVPMIVISSVAMAEPGGESQELATDREWDLTPPRIQPAYRSTPRYALLVFGHDRERRVWMVLDEATLFVDLNANGDLTESGERLEPDNPEDGSNRFGGSGSHTHFDVFELAIETGATDAGVTETSQFVLHHWIRAKDFVPATDFDKEIFARCQELGYENNTLWRKEGRGQGQTPLLFMPDPRDAQVCALDGPLTFVVKSPDRQVLKRGSAPCDLAFHIAVVGRSPRGMERSFYNALATSEVPDSAYLDVTIEYPSRAGSASPLRRTYTLKERC